MVFPEFLQEVFEYLPRGGAALCEHVPESEVVLDELYEVFPLGLVGDDLFLVELLEQFLELEPIFAFLDPLLQILVVVVLALQFVDGVRKRTYLKYGTRSCRILTRRRIPATPCTTPGTPPISSDALCSYSPLSTPLVCPSSPSFKI
jgi:hypothetical protein